MGFIGYISCTASFYCPLPLLRAVIMLIGRQNILAVNTFFFYHGSILSIPPRIYFRRESGDEIIFSSQLFETYFLARIAIHFNDFIVSFSLSCI